MDSKPFAQLSVRRRLRHLIISHSRVQTEIRTARNPLFRVLAGLGRNLVFLFKIGHAFHIWVLYDILFKLKMPGLGGAKASPGACTVNKGKD
jgi:hypothetical protein